MAYKIISLMGYIEKSKDKRLKIMTNRNIYSEFHVIFMKIISLPFIISLRL